jgi:hypothetical protein
MEAINLEGYTILDRRKLGGPNIKAITLQDTEGNILVHFFGTGAYNWSYNGSAVGAIVQLPEYKPDDYVGNLTPSERESVAYVSDLDPSGM